MTRRRFAYTMGGVPLDAPVEVSDDYIGGDGRQPIFTDRFMEGDRAPDGTDIGSRSKRAAWMGAMGAADASDFSPSYYQRVAAQRARDEVHGLRETIGRAVHNTQKRR